MQVTDGRQNGGTATTGGGKIRALLQKPETIRRLDLMASQHGMSGEQIARLAASTLSADGWAASQLQKCDPGSFLMAVMNAAQLGIDPSGVGGLGYILPYYDKKASTYRARFQLGYRGVAHVATRNGWTVHPPQLVFEGEAFTYRKKMIGGRYEVVLDHDPGPPGTWADLVCGYVVAEPPRGSHRVVVMWAPEFQALRRAGSDNPSWGQHPLRMAEKSLVNLLARRVSLEVDVKWAGDDESVARNRVDLGSVVDDATDPDDQPRVREAEFRPVEPSGDAATGPAGDDPSPEVAHRDGLLARLAAVKSGAPDLYRAVVGGADLAKTADEYLEGMLAEINRRDALASEAGGSTNAGPDTGAPPDVPFPTEDDLDGWDDSQ